MSGFWSRIFNRVEDRETEDNSPVIEIGEIWEEVQGRSWVIDNEGNRVKIVNKTRDNKLFILKFVMHKSKEVNHTNTLPPVTYGHIINNYVKVEE